MVAITLIVKSEEGPLLKNNNVEECSSEKGKGKTYNIMILDQSAEYTVFHVWL